jgi:hypothetical protein
VGIDAARACGALAGWRGRKRSVGCGFVALAWVGEALHGHALYIRMQVRYSKCLGLGAATGQERVTTRRADTGGTDLRFLDAAA